MAVIIRQVVTERTVSLLFHGEADNGNYHAVLLVAEKQGWYLFRKFVFHWQPLSKHL
jgi:hypothetical protein